jgi:hypothetical protein
VGDFHYLQAVAIQAGIEQDDVEQIPIAQGAVNRFGPRRVVPYGDPLVKGLYGLSHIVIKATARAAQIMVIPKYYERMTLTHQT